MLGLQHNIISLLYALRGSAEVYFSKIETNPFLGAEERLKNAERVIHTMQQLAGKALEITKKLGFALKTAEQSPAIIIPMSLQETWAITKRLLSAELRAFRIDVIEHIPEDFPKIKCCRKNFVEILYCLAKNAVDALRDENIEKSPDVGGKKLVIRAELAIRGETPWALITLADTGPGISNETLSKLFQPFFSTKDELRGNGLGLFLTKQLVVKNKGRISVSSFSGCGSTFSLEFPLANTECLEALGAGRA